MTQPRRQSAIEACANVVVGYGVAVAANLLVLPRFGLTVTASDAAGIGCIFTAISLVRSYVLRRVFNRWTR